MSEEYKHSTEVSIRFTDIDLLGHVSNSSYSAIFDDGRLNYFRDIFPERFDFENIQFVLVNHNIDFLHSAYLFDKVKVYSRTVRVGTKSVKMQQQIRRLSDDVLICQSESTLVGYSKYTRSSMVVEDEWVEHLERFEGRMLRG